MVESKEERQALKLFRQYATQRLAETDFKKPVRIQPQLSADDFKHYIARYKEIQELYDVLRCPPAIVKVAQDALGKRLDPKGFPFLGEEQELA